MNVSKQTEFPEERKGVITNLESIAWHCNNLLCPYCMEKHASLVNGLSSEIADGKEGDESTYRELSDIYSKEVDRLQKNKALHAFTDEDVTHYRDLARTWRRKLQGATEAGHSHSHEEEHEEHSGVSAHHHKEEEETLFKRCVKDGGDINLCRSQIEK